MTRHNINEMVDDFLAKTYGIQLQDADIDQLFRACATAVNDILRSLRRNYNAKVKEQKGGASIIYAWSFWSENR